MAQGWRITTINGLLLALYFVPAWTAAAFKIVVFPIRGIYERANIGPALYRQRHLSAVDARHGTLRLAAGAREVRGRRLLPAVRGADVASAAAASAAAAMRRSALRFCSAASLSVASMLAASPVGEAAAVRLHATESLMLLGGFALLAIDSQSYGVRRTPVPTDWPRNRA